jgi:hypothetical protein
MPPATPGKHCVVDPSNKNRGLVSALPCGEAGVGHLGVLLVPPGIPGNSPYMSDDMRLCAVSWETAGSDGSEILAVGMNGQLSC